MAGGDGDQANEAGGADLGDQYGIFQAYRMADVVRLRGGRIQYRHMRDEDDDPSARRQHDVQRALHYVRIFRRNLSDADIEYDSSPAERGASATDAQAYS